MASYMAVDLGAESSRVNLARLKDEKIEIYEPRLEKDVVDEAYQKRLKIIQKK